MMSEWDSLDVPLEDRELLEELELTTHLIIGANNTEEPLSQAEIDHLLGVERGRTKPDEEGLP